MRRHAGQRALYEAWSRSRGKPKRPGLLERLRPQLEKLRRPVAEKPANLPKVSTPVAEKPAPVTLKPPRPVERPELSRPSPAQPWLKTKAVQVNAGRIEISVPYQVAIAIGLLLILFLLVAFRLGQMDQRARYGTPSATPRANPAPAGAAATTDPPVSPRGSTSPAPAATAPTPQGDHWIVLAYHQRQADLEAVKLHFAQNEVDTTVFAVAVVRKYFVDNGFDTALLPSGDGFLLVTSLNKLYDNPERPGTNGFEMKEKIKRIGAGYKAPPGLDSFATNRFSDVYGMKIR